ISAIITPNYDQAIDDCFRQKQDILFSDACCKRFNKNPRGGILFKIHGSINHPKSMIYTIEQEKRLSLSKTETLQNILKDKILIVIGYSGRDFDICPLITSKKVYGYKKVVWLRYVN